MLPKSRDMYGRHWTKRYRLRPAFFGVVLEQLVEDQDGGAKWRRAEFPLEIGGAS